MAPASVHIFENHDSALQHWRSVGLRGRVVVHVDAHHDAWALKEFSSITIANFLTSAIHEGIREVVWVVPDASFDAHSSRAAIEQHLKRLAKQHRGKVLEITETSARAELSGVRMSICTRRNLPRFDAPVLLDIDTDYFAIPRVTYGSSDCYSAVPWCWPEELLADITASGLAYDVVTIAYSIEGGYLPLFWKFLGDELQARLIGDGSRVAGFAAIREAALAVYAGRVESAEEKYQVARQTLPDSAAPDYHLALLYLRLGRVTAAREAYRRAIDIDPTYATPYRNAGLAMLDRDNVIAEQEFRDALELDPRDATALYGLARVAASAKQWTQAAEYAERAIELAPDFLDAHRLMGTIQQKLGNPRPALSAYDTSLQLALLGKRPLHGGSIGDAAHASVLDPEHGAVQAAAARLLAAEGKLKEATAAYQIAIASRYDGFNPRAHLASILLRTGDLVGCMRHLLLAVRALPKHIANAWKSWRSRRSGRHAPWRYREYAARVREGSRIASTASTCQVVSPNEDLR